MELRHTESQAALQDESRAASEQGSSVLQVDLPAPRPPGGGLAQRDMGGFSLSLSFEELNGVGLEEQPRLCNPHWPVSLKNSNHCLNQLIDRFLVILNRF